MAIAQTVEAAAAAAAMGADGAQGTTGGLTATVDATAYGVISRTFVMAALALAAPL